MANVVETVFRGVDEISGNVGKINASVGQIHDKFADLGATIRTTMGLLGIGGIVGSLITFTKSSIDAADAVGELSKQAGFSAERFQRLQFAFRQNGVNSQEFEGAMRSLNTRLGQFVTTGSGPAAEAIKQLGLAQDIASGKIGNAEQLFDALLVKLGDFKQASQIAALSAQFFGREAGSKLATTMAQGKEGVDALARSAGSVFSDDQVAKADALNDAFARMASTVGNKLKGAFVDAAAAMADFFRVPEVESDKHLQQRLDYLKNAIEVLGRGGTMHGAAKGDIPAMQAEIAQLEALTKARAAANKPAGGGAANIVTEGEFAGKGQLSYSERLKYDSLKGFDLKDIGEQLITGNETIVEKLRAQRAKLGLLTPGNGADVLLQDVQVTAQRAETGSDLSRQNDERLASLGLSKFPTISQQAQQAFDDMSEKAKKAKEQMVQFGEATAAALESSAWKALIDGKPRDAIRGLVEDFAQLIFKMLILKPLADNLAKSFSNFGSNAPTGGGSAGGFFATLFSRLFGKGLASGGWTSPGALHPVLEQGDEFLISGDRSRVVPLAKMAANGQSPGGGGVYAPVTNVSVMTNINPAELEMMMRRRDAANLAEFQRLSRDGLLS